jgi:proline iminopeptidase
MSFKSLRGRLGKNQAEVAGLPWVRRFIRNNNLPGLTLSVLSSAVLVGCIVIAACTTAAAVSIKRSEYLPFGGAKLYLLIRGADKTAPVLLWLHGGPGGAERPLFRYFNGDLEKHFVVVYWDQRGAGRSFNPRADPHRLTIAQHLVDLDAVVNHLLKSLGQNKIILMGHSWGAPLGLLYAYGHGEKVSTFIGVNPLVSTRGVQQAQYDFVLAEASRRRDGKALTRLREIGVPPYNKATQVLAMEKLVQRYGGVFHREPKRTWIMIRAIFSGLVVPWEIPRLIHANNVSLAAMNEELLSLDLSRSVPSLDVPVLFFLGRYDRHTDAKLAASYFETLRAPVKRLVWFEKSAHNIPFEEPGLFNATVPRELQALAIEKVLPSRYVVHARNNHGGTITGPFQLRGMF